MFFTCWNQLAVLMFGQFSNRESLRDVALATQALSEKANHLVFRKYATKSNLPKANHNRDYRIFEEFAYRVIAEARECRATDIFKLNGHVYAFDSTTIELCLNGFKWAIYRKNQRKGRENSFYIFDRGYNNDIRTMKWKRRFPPGSGILSDAIGCWMAIAQKKMEIERSIYEMMQMASVSLTETFPLNNLFANLTTILSMNLMIRVNLLTQIYSNPYSGVPHF